MATSNGMKNKTLLWVVVAVVIVVIVVMARRSNTTPVASPTITASTSISVSSAPKATPAQTNKPILSYQEALNKYGGTRFQFNSACQATPTHMVIKKGSAIMLDNRANVARTVSVGTTKYSLMPYGFRIVVPTSKTYPATMLIDCGAQQNVATLLIEQ